MSLENLITDTADDGNTALQETASFASATVHNYKDPVTYVSELTFRNAGPRDGDYAARWKLLTGIELSDLVTVTTTHPGGGGFSTADHFVESIAYELKPLQGDEWDVTLTVGLSSAAHFSFKPASWNPPAGPVLTAMFAVAPDGLSVTCFDQSTPGPSGPITAWDLNWGDGSSHATGPGPWSHTYAAGGTYSLTLQVTGTSPDGTASHTRSVSVS